MRSPRPVTAALLVLTLTVGGPAVAQPTVPPAAALSDEGELARSVTLYESGKYGECVVELGRLLDPSDPQIEEPDVVERARLYLAACLIATGKTADADEQMREAIRENPQMRPPDSLVFPQAVVDRFIRVREGMLDEIKKAEEERLKKAREAAKAAAARREREKARVKKLEELAQREVEVTKNRRWIAAVPFGVGQFQNDDTALGYLFLGTEVALAGTALGAMIVQLSLNARADDVPPPNPAELNANLKTAQDVLVFSSWGFLAVATAGIVEAQLSFEPEVRRVRKKPLPKELRGVQSVVRASKRSSSLRLTPGVTPLPGGLGVGLGGRF